MSLPTLSTGVTLSTSSSEQDVPVPAPSTEGPGLAARAAMATDAALAARVAAALSAQSLAVLGDGKPGGDADPRVQRSWGLAQRALAPSGDDVARAQHAIAALADGPAEAYCAAEEGHGADAVADEALQAALTAVWPSLAGA